MPRRRRNKSEAVRQVLEEHPEASTDEVISLLAERRMKVRPPLVYVIRSESRRRAKKRVLRGGPNGDATYSAELILGVKHLAKEAGGFKNLKQLVQVLAD
jgi:hypothetical protein